MLDQLKIDELLDGKVESRYSLVTAAARRARQINEYTATLGIGDSLGIPGPQVHPNSQHPLTIAIEELRAGKLNVSISDEEVDPTGIEASAVAAAQEQLRERVAQGSEPVDLDEQFEEPGDEVPAETSISAEEVAESEDFGSEEGLEEDPTGDVLEEDEGSPEASHGAA